MTWPIYQYKNSTYINNMKPYAALPATPHTPPPTITVAHCVPHFGCRPRCWLCSFCCGFLDAPPTCPRLLPDFVPELPVPFYILQVCGAEYTPPRGPCWLQCRAETPQYHRRLPQRSRCVHQKVSNLDYFCYKNVYQNMSIFLHNVVLFHMQFIYIGMCFPGWWCINSSLKKIISV